MTKKDVADEKSLYWCPHCNRGFVDEKDHHPEKCCRLKSIEYFEDGKIKRIEYKD